MEETVKNSEQAKNKKPIKKTTRTIIIIVLVLVSFISGFFVRHFINGSENNALNEVAMLLKKYGVFDSATLSLRDLTTEELSEIIIGNLSDDYARYYTPEEYKKIREAGAGNYAGIGISFKGENPQVFKTIFNSPAFFAGIKEDDLLTSVKYGGEEKQISNIEDFASFLKTVPDGENFELFVLRGETEIGFMISEQRYNATYVCYKDSGKTVHFLSDFGKAPVLTATDADNSEIPSDTGYVYLESFEGDAAGEIEKALTYMKGRGKTKLILDLRGNGGGYMTVLSSVATYFINNGGARNSPVAYSCDNKGNYMGFFVSGNKFQDYITKIAVLADERTASASECLIGAMLYYKDNFEASSLIIENEELVDGIAKTFGKGIMQTTYPLSNGGGLKLTTAVVYQPDKATCIHGTGITVSGTNAVLKSDGQAISRAASALSA